MTPASFENELQQRLAALRTQGLYRELRCIDSAQSPHIRIKGGTLLNFSSNDYLGLANDPLLKEAAVRAVERFGAGAGASRLISGSLAPHHELEENLAQFKNTQAALCFSTGYAAALGTICALVGTDDVVVLDKLVHACIVDAARLCGAKLRVFAHNDLNDLEEILKWTDQRAKAGSRGKTLVVTESLFSMDGDHAPLLELVALKEKYGAWLMVDEAHATGLYGAQRRGLAEEMGVSERIEIQMGTLGKALGASGGYICGSHALIDYLVNRSRTFIFSTAPVPAAVGAATAGIRLVQADSGRQRCHTLWERVKDFCSEIDNGTRLAEVRSPSPLLQEREGGRRSPTAQSSLVDAAAKGQALERHAALPKAIIPLMVGDETKAVELSCRLLERGIYIPAIRFPTVARGSARLRLTLTAAHTSQDVRAVVDALSSLRF